VKTSSNTNIWTGHQDGLARLCGYDVELHLQIMQSNILQKKCGQNVSSIWVCAQLQVAPRLSYFKMCWDTEQQFIQDKLYSIIMNLLKKTQYTGNNLLLCLFPETSTFSLCLKKHNLWVNTPVSSQYIPSNIPSCFRIDI
jgi:hypothetical protein